MTESVILSNPALVFLMGTAFLVQLVFARMDVRGLWQLAPAVLCAACCVWAVWLGCGLEELSIVLCAFFALCLGESGRKKK